VAAATDLPLIRNYNADSAFAYRRDIAISAAHFLADVAELVIRLPGASHIVNLCSDRYHFAVGFAAALSNRQVNLLPPNQTPTVLEQLLHAYPDAYCLVDSENEFASARTVMFPELSATPSVDFHVPLLPASQVAAILLTSGSTGQPVPHEKSWGGLVRSVLAERVRLGLAETSAAGILGTVPPQHMYGLESTVLLPMQGGLALHAARPFYPADVCAYLEGMSRPRALVTTPVHLRALLAESVALPRLDFLICATAPLSPQLAAAAEAAFAAPLYEVYGCTEAGELAMRRTVETAEWETLPGIAFRQDEKGTWARGGNVDAEVLLNDVIELHDSSRFLLHGRNADLVNIAGKRTSIANLNYHLNSIEGVRDGVFVMPEEQGETVTRLMAFVVAPGVTRDALMQALRSRIDAAFLPRPLHLVASLPRNTTGKLPREALDTLLAELSGDDE
jgi:acyl-coenzyme A synthetase/AMP-(fatty) acid ligase